MQNLFIKNKNYTIENKIITVIPDCFVKRNKLVTEKNKFKDKPSSGESRIYICSQSYLKSSEFFTFPNSIKYLKNMFNSNETDICFFSKDNLLSYLNKAQAEYTNPTLNFFYDITVDFQSYIKQVNSLDDYIPFTIFNHKGSKDTSRFYINSLDDIWTLFRNISLPQISHLIIYKLRDQVNTISYYFELTLDEKHSSKNKIEREEIIKETIINDTNISSTDRTSLVKSRNGQGKFRNNVISIMKSCPFTGITDRTLLRASHIIPWVDCENNFQRLDGFNGLALTPTYDVLFDKGLISFNNDGSLLISSLLSVDTIERLHLIKNKIYDISNIDNKRNDYLQYHRENVFKK